MALHDQSQDVIFLKTYADHKLYIDTGVNYLKTNFPKKYNFWTMNQKYSAKYILVESLYFLKSGVSYADYRGPINHKTLNKHILFFAKHNILENIYSILLSQYLKVKKYSKLKYQSIDTTNIQNKNGKEKLGRNVKLKNKNCYKISIISDVNRIPLTISINPGNDHDAKIALANLTNHKYTSDNTSIKPYLLG